jgi:phospholipase C
MGTQQITHAFVLMLENHSFDNVFAFSGIPGIQHATSADSETYENCPYPVSSPAPPTMPTDPGHEFLDVVEQLCGPSACYRPGHPYPALSTNTGFVANYATTKSEITSGNPRRPMPTEWGDVMKCFDTPSQLPVIYELATEFAICDHWFSSLPGPTWPNRFFVHGASSGGWDDSPSTLQTGIWELPGEGFVYPSGSSIFDALRKKGIEWRVYADETGDLVGRIPQVAALKRIQWPFDVSPVARLAHDLQGHYPYGYTFIEPNYGDVFNGAYTGGSSQHPMDGVAGGERLIKMVYEAIRASPLWPNSLLVITYDEHGGFYDSCKPGAAPAPADGGPTGPPANRHGFAFEQYGVRVPAVIVSPRIPRGLVSHTVYDHASVPATVERLFGLPPLTNRDKNANDLLGLLSLPSPRTDCPVTLADPAPEPAVAARSVAAAASADVSREPLPESGNALGFLGILRKTDLELAEGDPAEIAKRRARFEQIRTRGEARAYAEEVYAKAQAARATRAHSGPPAPAGTVATSAPE